MQVCEDVVHGSAVQEDVLCIEPRYYPLLENITYEDIGCCPYKLNEGAVKAVYGSQQGPYHKEKV